MIAVFEGANGSGKSFMLTRLLFEDWKLKATIYPNFPLLFPNDNERVERWHTLPEIYHLTHGVIAIDEAQKLFHARRWQSTPMSFLEMISQHRKQFLDVYTTTPSIGDIDINYRKLIAERYTCQSLLRLPKNQRVHPFFQWIRVQKRIRDYSGDTERIGWKKAGNAKWYFISRFWTKTLYETYASVGLNKFICQVEFKLKTGRKLPEWLVHITDRDLINSGKARK